MSCAGRAIYRHVPAMVRAGREDGVEQRMVRSGGGTGKRKKKTKKNTKRR